MSETAQSPERFASRITEAIECYLDLLEPDMRARVALAAASRMVSSAAYHTVQVDTDAPRLHLFDMVRELDATADRLRLRRAS
jgi:hypothetical protein